MEAASDSLKKSIREIDAHLEGKGVSGTPGYHRAELHATLAEFAARWQRKDFNRGRRECFQSFEETGEVPKLMRANFKRAVWWRAQVGKTQVADKALRQLGDFAA